MNNKSVIEQAIVNLDCSYNDQLREVLISCSDFINTCVPLYKPLPSSYDSVTRIKLRHRKADKFHLDINDAFDIRNLYQRSLTCYSNMFQDIDEDYKWFAVYPQNGYRFFYNPVLSTIDDLRHIDPHFLPQVVDLSFSSEKLQGITQNETEVIIYDIPAYYAIAVETK